MNSLWISVEIAHGKRREFCDALSYTMPAAPAGPVWSALYEAIDGPDHLCWHGRWKDADALRTFLHSPAYRAVCGAARVLGTTHMFERGETIAPVATGRGPRRTQGEE